MVRNIILTFALTLISFAVSAQTTPTFQDFLAQFPFDSLPYTFNKGDLEDILTKKVKDEPMKLDWDYYQFLPELERSAQYSSRTVSPEPVARFETKEYHVVLYNIARGLSRGKKTFAVSIFDKEGKYISSHFVAGVDTELLTVATIGLDLTAAVDQFKVTFDIDGNILLTDQITVTINLTKPGNPDRIE